MSSSAGPTKASPFPLWKLPDTLLLQILKEGCDNSTQQAAYRSCRGLRDFCYRNIKSTVVKIVAAKSLDAVQAKSSSAMCPKTASSIEQLTVCFEGIWAFTGSERIEIAYTYLQQLTDATFFGSYPSANTRCRMQQLAQVASVRLSLPKCKARTSQHWYILSRLLSQFPKLRSLRTSVNDALLYINAPQLQHVICDDHVAPKDLNLFASRHLGIEKLEFSTIKMASSKRYKQALVSFKDLSHLALRFEVKKLLPAGLLVSLKQLVSLALYNVEVSGVHRLTHCHITHLTLGSVRFRLADQQTKPVKWPALKCVTFAEGTSIMESGVRAILPWPHPGLRVNWPANVTCVLDTEPHPQHGYVCVAHMKSFNTLKLFGNLCKTMLHMMVANGVIVRNLHVGAWNALKLGMDDIAACFWFPTAVSIHLDKIEADTPLIFYLLFAQCPALKSLYVPRWCVPGPGRPCSIQQIADGSDHDIIRISSEPRYGCPNQGPLAQFPRLVATLFECRAGSSRDRPTCPQQLASHPGRNFYEKSIWGDITSLPCCCVLCTLQQWQQYIF